MIGERFLFGFFKHSILFRLAILMIFFILIFGFIIHLLEPKQFSTFFEGIWWAIVTVATVGYGDYAPDTVWGRLLGILLILLGTGFFTTYFVTLSTIAVSRENAYLNGHLPYSRKGHIIIIGWNERVRTILHHYANEEIKEEIVLIDESLKEKPLISPGLYFIKGNPTHAPTLRKANMSEASKILITADQFKSEEYADMQTILTLVAIRGISPSIYTIAEILTYDQKENARHAGADKIICTNHLTGETMYKQLF
ncbi:MAG TPA: potassium channel family protein [Bacillus sp. (in: firmicutes)]|nr:potassium channel family protein [Bacillus sp. (in: firmicutes)]